MSKQTLSNLLLEWYNQNGRNLPWRVKGGPHPDPYVILVSELMLQQTTVKTVIPYFHRFMERFPTIADLAAAPLEEVYFYWQGLGYYTRARSLHATAQTIIEQYGGRFPDNRQDVLKLKGIGEYTVASFLALAFNQPETVIDGNVIRIICRMYGFTGPVEKIMPLIREKAQALTKTSCRLCLRNYGFGRRRLHPQKTAMPALSLAKTLPIKKPPGYRKYPQPHQTGKKRKAWQRISHLQPQRRCSYP